MMKLSERISKFIFQIRGMWTAAEMIYDAQRNVLDMTIELVNEIERRIQLEAKNDAFKQKVKELESMAKHINEGRLTEAEMHAHLYFGGTFKRKDTILADTLEEK